MSLRKLVWILEDLLPVRGSDPSVVVMKLDAMHGEHVRLAGSHGLVLWEFTVHRVRPGCFNLSK